MKSYIHYFPIAPDVIGHKIFCKIVLLSAFNDILKVVGKVFCNKMYVSLL